MMKDNFFFDQFLGLISNIFDAYSTVLFLKEKEGQYGMKASFSLGDSLLKDVSLEPGQGVVGWILRDKRPLLINNFDREGDCLGYYHSTDQSKIKSFMGCPLSNGQGVLCVDSKKTYSFSSKDQKILHQCVQIIEALSVDLYQRHSLRREQTFYYCLQLLRNLRLKFTRWNHFLDNFLQIVSEFSGLEYAVFTSRDERGQGYYVEGWNSPLFEERFLEQKFNIQSGLIGWVFRNNQYLDTSNMSSVHLETPLFDKEIQTPPLQTIICLPTIFYMRTRGVLVLADKKNLAISDELKKFLFLVSEHFSIFLENLYLKNKLQQLRHELGSR